MSEKQKINGIFRYWWGVLEPITEVDSDERKQQYRRWYGEGREQTFAAWCVGRCWNDVMLHINENKKEVER